MMEPDQSTSPTLENRKESLWALAYYAAYVGYLFFSLESEVRHWLTMVVIPFGLIYLYQARRRGHRGVKPALQNFGIDRTTLWNGFGWAILIGLVLCALQFYLSRDSGRILQLLTSGKFLYLFPIALGLMLLTAGATEEFFFRGFLQTRLQQLFPSKVAAVVVTSILFGLYHLPYAYLNPRWPSHGNLSEAVTAALGQGIPIGLILGTIYVRSKNNLLACIIVHSLLDSFPAMLSIKFQAP